MPKEQVTQFLKDMKAEARSIRKNIIRLGWHMRGACSLDDLAMMSASDIDQINEMIDENMELTKKSQLPFI
jgi:hypothetical protein